MHILLGITGSLAAIKVPEIIRLLQKKGHTVQCMVSSGGKALSSLPALEALTGKRVLGPEVFGENLSENPYLHLSGGKAFDVICIAPASANTLARLAVGDASDLLSTTVLGASCPILLAPAMNPKMWHHPATQKNKNILEEYGYTIIPPATGEMACGEVGEGRLPEVEDIVAYCERSGTPQMFTGKKVLISLGGTQEKIDPVRYLGNASSGKMGKALAESFWKHGAEVTICAGNHTVSLSSRFFVFPTLSTAEMAEKMKNLALSADIVVFAAAVADFTPETFSPHKKRSGDPLSLPLIPTVDIAQKLGAQKRGNHIFLGFCLSDEEKLEPEMKRKKEEKNFSYILGNTRDNIGREEGKYLLWDGKNIEEYIGEKKDIAEKIVQKIQNFP